MAKLFVLSPWVRILLRDEDLQENARNVLENAEQIRRRGFMLLLIASDARFRAAFVSDAAGDVAGVKLPQCGRNENHLLDDAAGARFEACAGSQTWCSKAAVLM